MKKLMTKHFSKWARKQNIPVQELSKALSELENGVFEANLGGNVIKKRIRFQGIVKAGVAEQLFATKKKIEQFLFIVFRKPKNQTFYRKSFTPLKNLQKYYCHFRVRN